MKKLIALILMLALTQFVPVTAESAQTEAATAVRKVGILSTLNMSEEEMTNLLSARELIFGQITREGYRQSIFDKKDLASTVFSANINYDYEVVYYDTLDALVMALEVGDIYSITIYSTTADYLCANNDQLFQPVSVIDPNDTDNAFFKQMFSGVLSNDFAFMMLKGNEALRDEFNAAIAEIKADGTLDRLVADHIDAAIAGKDIAPVEMPKIDGAQTVKVAITGALPPMDYIAPDGTPAGFNTALLAEIGNRIGKNIELVQVDSLGRAAALASGTVDAAFWTRTSAGANTLAAMTQQEKDANKNELVTVFTEEEIETIEKARAIFDYAEYGAIDMPEGTIITDAYFSDYITPVISKRVADAFFEKIGADAPEER